MADADQRLAWVDESVLPARGATPHGAYLLVATIVDPHAMTRTRDVLRTLNSASTSKLHWKNEGLARRHAIGEALRHLDAAHTVVVGAPVDARKQERARRVCLERLVFELAHRDVDALVLETRSDALNRRDTSMFDSLRRRAIMPGSMRFTFAHAGVEPLLWIPDIVAGATGTMLRGGDPTVFEALHSQIEIIPVDLP